MRDTLRGRGVVDAVVSANPTVFIIFIFFWVMANFTVLSWNIRGLNSAIKRSLVFKYLKNYNPQICILQETHLVGARVLPCFLLLIFACPSRCRLLTQFIA